MSTALVSAQEVIDAGEGIVYVNLGPVAAGASGAAVTVLTEDDLAEGGTEPLTAKLAKVPGISIRTQGPVGTQAGITIRGVNQNNIAVRFDGIDISDPTGPQVAYNFGTLVSSSVGRIDVLRGSESAIWGSEAIGGAVLMQSKRASGEGTEIEGGLEIGSYNTRSADLAIASRAGRLDLSFGVQRYQTDGFSAYDENLLTNAEPDGAEQTRANLYVGYDVTDTTRIELSGFVADTFAEYDTSAGDNLVNTQDMRQRAGRLAFVQGFGGAELTASFSRMELDRTEMSMFGPFTTEGARDEADIRLAFSPTDTTDATIGASRTTEAYADNFGSDYENSVDSLYAEVIQEFGAATVTGNLRRDEHSAYGTNWSGRLALAYDLGNGTTLRSAYGTGYRAPSNYELYSPWEGDPTLQVEQSRSFDIGLEKDYGAGSVSVTAFALEAEDVIAYTFASGYFQAPGTVTRRGLEIATDWSFANGTELTGAYTYVTTGGSAVLDPSVGWSTAVPAHQLALGVAHDYGKTTVRADMLAALDRPGLDDYAVFNLGAEYEVNDTMTAYVRVENVFDTEYQTVPGYGTSDRAAFFGFRVSN
ncbi:TonB-dependent receptor plug domain-containing protein [Mesobacterium pallidum]|uniref:TonB-dependent receptor plug domain-containing protein n=1 Tax=Mesobacterium pallidum TaxID=2872037 RepID=UPI001EE2D5CE|nr:TonB-dependent receptor [Mesobacterium pallidum]